MARKRLVVFAAVSSVLLIGGGVAAACVGVPGVQAASATFDATTVGDLSSNSCTAANGDTLVSTRGSYTGSASSSDAQLNGPLVIYARSLVDTTTGVGYVEGRFEVGPDGSANDGHFVAALSGGGATGFAEAELQSPDGRLLASLSSTFDPQNGFSDGSLGTGSTNGAGLVLSQDQGCSSSSTTDQSNTGDGNTSTTQTLVNHSHSNHGRHNGKAHHHSSSKHHKH